MIFYLSFRQASPLTRALLTSDLILSHDIVPQSVPRYAQQLARERLYLSSDVGRSSDELQKEFPAWDLTNLGEGKWWYNVPEGGTAKFKTDFDFSRGLYVPEPKEIFIERIVELKNWILGREESCIAIVAHWGVLKALTGRSFANSEIFECNFDQLLDHEKHKLLELE